MVLSLIMCPQSLLTQADRFARIIDDLRAVVSASVARGVEHSLAILICAWLQRVKTRFAALASGVGQRRFLGRRAAEKRPSPRPDAPSPAPDSIRVVLHNFTWMAAIHGWHGSAHCTRLRAFLAEPEMAEILARDPRIAALLRPLCRIIGVEEAALSPDTRASQTVDGADPAADSQEPRNAPRPARPIPVGPQPRPGLDASARPQQENAPPRGPRWIHFSMAR
jgi:hypothetical protein